jgi:hypothetical protein
MRPHLLTTPTRFLIVVVLLLACAPGAAADGAPIADVSVSLSGPVDGQVGDVLTYTVTFVNHGPDTPPHATVYFGYDTTEFSFVGTDYSQCDANGAGQNRVNQVCDFRLPPPGPATVIAFQLRVVQRNSTTVSLGALVAFATDPIRDNDAQLLTVLGPPTEITNVSPPTISGATTVGSTLAADSGQWSPAYNYGYIYHWLRCASATYCATLNDTGSSYALTSNDAGCQLRVIVAATSGAATSANEGSAPSDTVQPGGPCNVVAGRGTGGGGGGGGGAGVPAKPLVFAVTSLPTVEALSSAGVDVVLVEDGSPPYTLAVVAGTMPRLYFNQTTGHLVGDPPAAGTFTFRIRITDSAGTAIERDFTMKITASAINGAQSGQAPPRLPRFVGCASFTSRRTASGVVRPRSVVFACADRNFYVTHITWSTWNSETARGRGTGKQNDCTPKCASGHFHSYLVSVQLAGVARCGPRNQLEYTRASWRFLNRKPTGSRPQGGESFRCR